MHKVNAHDLPAQPWTSPKGKYASLDQELSVALGRDPQSLDLLKRHPFDVEICRIPAGKAACPFHSHSAQWEFYYVLSGQGRVRDAEGLHDIREGDAFLFRPDEPHQLWGGDETELTVMIVADNPPGESCHYPDSQKWMVRSPERRILQSGALDYFAGEE